MPVLFQALMNKFQHILNMRIVLPFPDQIDTNSASRVFFRQRQTHQIILFKITFH